MRKLALCFLIVVAACLAVPTEITIQGRLSDDIGTPYEGDYLTSFYLYDVETGGLDIWREEQTVTYTNGLFHVYLGNVTPLTIDVFDGIPKYLSMSVAGDEITPRRKLVSVPYAFYAENTNFDTLGAYLDTSFAGEVSYIDSVSFVAFIDYIDSITYIDSISIIDSIGFIDFIFKSVVCRSYQGFV